MGCICITCLLYTSLVRNSVSYMVMARLGLDADKVYSPDDFAGISNFNSQEVLNAVGIATSDIAEMALLPVSRTISTLSKENRIIDEQGQSEYNKDIKDERSQSDERNHIHDGGRLQSSEPEAAGADGSDSRQMVADEENLSEGTSQNPVLPVSYTHLVRQLIPKNIPISQTEDFVCKALEHYNKFLRSRADRDSR